MSHEGSRFARHALLAEIGRTGQETLSDSRYLVPTETDARVARVARTYLDRAGLARSDEGRPVVMLDVTVAALAGDPALEHAAAFLLGALAAVEHVKSELGIGRPMTSLPTSLSS